MRPPEYYIGKPIESLQTMLRTLSDLDPLILPIIPDGRYGSNTYASVRSFQERAGLSPTGVTDLETWNRLVAAYDRLLLQSTVPSIRPIWPLLQTVFPGETNRHLYLVQAMLTALEQDLPELTVPALSGILDDATSIGLRQIQAASGLTESGNLDTATWNSLNTLYRALIGNGKA